MIASNEALALQHKADAEETLWRKFRSDFVEHKLGAVGLVMLAVVIFVALFAPWISPQNPYDLASLNLFDGRLPPLSRSSTGITYWLGTDDQGRDMLSAIFYGLRISLGVGVFSALIALVFGTTVGLLSAYIGGWSGTVIMRIVDLQLSFPSILIALILVAIMGQGLGNTVLALVIVQWAYFARTVRASAIVERNREYIEAARCLGLSDARIIVHHLLVNCIPPLIVVMTVQMAHAITLEATLSFLGIGLPITQPSLGLLIANGFAYVMSGKYWISLFPGVALLIAIVAINLVGDALRDILNPRLQS